MDTIDFLRIMLIPYLADQEDVDMFGPYLTGLTKPADEPTQRWFTCRPCLVQWKVEEKKSNCFVCGKWGTRGQYVR